MSNVLVDHSGDRSGILIQFCCWRSRWIRKTTPGITLFDLKLRIFLIHYNKDVLFYIDGVNLILNTPEIRVCAGIIPVLIPFRQRSQGHYRLFLFLRLPFEFGTTDIDLTPDVWNKSKPMRRCVISRNHDTKKHTR